MPNHITNRLRFKGDPSLVETARNAIKGPNGSVDFNSILPMPEGLSVEASCNEVDIAKTDEGIANAHERVIARRDRGAKHIRPQIVEQCRRNIREHGYAYWYDWACDAWGTKWNAYGIREDGDVIEFETAWSCPHPFIKALAERFPALEVEVEWADEDIGYNCGRLLYHRGTVYLRDEPAGGSGEARAFAYRVKGYSPSRIAEREAGE